MRPLFRWDLGDAVGGAAARRDRGDGVLALLVYEMWARVAARGASGARAPPRNDTAVRLGTRTFARHAAGASGAEWWSCQVAPNHEGSACACARSPGPEAAAPETAGGWRHAKKQILDELRLTSRDGRGADDHADDPPD